METETGKINWSDVFGKQFIGSYGPHRFRAWEVNEHEWLWEIEIFSHELNKMSGESLSSKSARDAMENAFARFMWYVKPA